MLNFKTGEAMRIKFVLVCIFLPLIILQQSTPKQNIYAAPATQSAEAAVLFDDFNYKSYDDPTLKENGWTPRSTDGWPGIPGAKWVPEELLTFVDDANTEGNRLAQLNASTDGTPENTKQAQLCQERKFLDGTYAARVRFTNKPVEGPDGDNVVQTFYMIAPYTKPLDPNFSEMDFEYLPNGGWGARGNVFHFTTWEKVQIEPWNADNKNTQVPSDFEGWHTLVLQASNGNVTYFIDGEETASHGDEYYPEVPMSINFNLWFIVDGGIKSNETRKYIEQIDWVYFTANKALSPDEVDAAVKDLRAAPTTFVDTVPTHPELTDPICNL
jgi:hypothetical protein